MKRTTTLCLFGLLLLAGVGGRLFASQPGLKENERIIFLGDSITQAGTQPDGYVTLVSRSIAAAYPRHGIEVVGAGRGGNRVPDLLARLERDVMSKQPSLVVIYIGINDVWHWTKPDPKTQQPRQGTTAADYEAGLREMIRKVQALKARVMLCTPSVIGEQVNASDPNYRMLEEYAAICRKVAQDTGAQLVDLRRAFLAYLGEHNSAQADRGILTQDGVHLSKRGNRLVADEMLRALGVPLQAADQAQEPTNSAEAAAKALAAEKKAAREAAVAAKYHAWVATLSPERQAWERILQANLGGFYLPAHQTDKVAGKANAWDFVPDDPQLPRVLLIGDSVSRGYTLAARAALAGQANVHRAPENCGGTSRGLSKIEVWLGDGRWDLIHFNFGIHDRGTSLADYSKRLEQLIARLQQTGAKLVWASTTPIPDDPAQKQTAASIVERNRVAAEIMRRHKIPVNDLFTAVTPHLGDYQPPNNVHFNEAGYGFLGQQVAAAIVAQLGPGAKSAGK